MKNSTTWDKADSVKDLPMSILMDLEYFYRKEPIFGIRLDTYIDLLFIFENRLFKYRSELRKNNANVMFSKTRAFAKAFEIDSDESPAFFDLLLCIERCITENPQFNSKCISECELSRLRSVSWNKVCKDYKYWRERRFDDTKLKIGIIRICKIFYSVIKGVKI